MSNYVGFGTVTTDTQTVSVSCRGWATMSAHLDSGVGTWTWQFKGPDGVWRNIYAGGNSITLQAYTVNNIINVYFGTDVAVRGSATAGTTPVWKWQIMSGPNNRNN